MDTRKQREPLLEADAPNEDRESFARLIARAVACGELDLDGAVTKMQEWDNAAQSASSPQRPTAQTPDERKAVVLRFASVASTLNEVCELADVPRSTLWAWRRRDRKFRDSFEEARSGAVADS